MLPYGGGGIVCDSPHLAVHRIGPEPKGQLGMYGGCRWKWLCSKVRELQRLPQHLGHLVRLDEENRAVRPRVFPPPFDQHCFQIAGLHACASIKRKEELLPD